MRTVLCVCSTIALFSICCDVLPCLQLLHPPAPPADMSSYMLTQYVKLKYKFTLEATNTFVPSGDGNNI